MSTRVAFPASTAEAVGLLAAAGPAAAPLAGGTWVMRAGLRGEPAADTYVSLRRIPALRAVAVEAGLRIGACVTHAELAAALAPHPAFAGLRDAAARSANPAVRAMATVGGAVSTPGFAASDLVPALLALEADVVVERPGGSETVPLERFMALRGRPEAGRLVTAVHVGSPPARSAHVRLTLRAAGDYPVAIVDVCDPGTGAPRVALGSVEAQPARWRALEDALAGGEDPQVAATRLAAQLTPRDGVDAEGWYRVAVLPALVRRALQALEAAA